jgi:putative ABC transport system permease protein
VSILNRKLRRDMVRSKGMLSAVVAIIALGIMCFVSMVSMYLNLDGARRSYYARSRMADFWIDLKKAPLTELDVIGRVHGVSEFLPRISFLAPVDLEDELKPLSGVVISMPDIRRPLINDILLKSGGYFTEQRREEVIVYDPFARARGIRVGDTIHLILNNKRQSLTVVGTAIGSEYVHNLGPGALIPDPRSHGVFWVKTSFAEDACDMQGACNQVVGLLSPDQRQRPGSKRPSTSTASPPPPRSRGKARTGS